MEISNPRRILAVSLSGETHHLSRVIKELTGTHPEAVSDSLAGITHDLPLETPYYTATVPIWLDLVSNPTEWSASFLSPEAKEVLDVLGGVMVVFALPTTGPRDDTRALLEEVGKVVREGLGGWEWDGVGLCLGVGEDVTDEWEDACAECGLEFVQVGGRADGEKNEFGEKTGIPRALEALQANDWAQAQADIASDFGSFEEADGEANLADGPAMKDKDPEHGDDLDPESLDFGFDKEDFAGLRQAIWKGGGDGDGDDELGEEDVQKVEEMMRKLQAAREAGEGLPEEQRKRMARRAVDEVMKEL